MRVIWLSLVSILSVSVSVEILSGGNSVLRESNALCKHREEWMLGHVCTDIDFDENHLDKTDRAHWIVTAQHEWNL